MSRVFAVAGGLLFVASLAFFGASYDWRFEGGGTWSLAESVPPALVDALLFTAFALHHSVFARAGLKQWVQRIGPPELERSIYVWVSSLLFLAVCAAWQPVPGVLWAVTGAPGRILGALQLVALAFILLAARRLDALALAGIRQAFERRDGPHPSARGSPSPPLDERGPYAFVRHPIYLGWCLVVWCVQVMNGTRLVFAAVSSLYLVIAIVYEERDLCRTFGAAYERYSRKVRWRLIPFVY